MAELNTPTKEHAMTGAKQQPYDRSSKWLIQHHGDSMLRLAKIAGIKTWRPAQAEVVQPRQLPDGLLEVRLQGEQRDDLFLLEVATYPERRVGNQLSRDLMLVYLDGGEWPEAVTLVLRPKGKFRVPSRLSLRSRCGLSSCRVRWRVVELWRVPAAELLAADDVGLIPWVPLAASADPPDVVLRRCRDVIDQRASAAEKPNPLAVTQIFTSLRYNDVRLLSILGGKKAMIESPLIQELVADRARQDLLAVLETRFGRIPDDLDDAIEAIEDDDKLTVLLRKAVSCPDVDAFRNEFER
jgi:hypothetical protein